MRMYYSTARTFLRYDDTHIIAYLNEEVETNKELTDENGKKYIMPVAYSYEGVESDGGTILEHSGTPTYETLAEAIIRKKYTVSDELAIHRHVMYNMTQQADEETQKKYVQEWQEYDQYCEQAKMIAKCWINNQGG